MESTRTHTLPIILAFVCLLVGFFVGSVIVNVSLSGKLKKGGNLYPGIVANTIMTKRMLAIKEAVKKGKNTYEFEISGLHPILGKN